MLKLVLDCDADAAWRALHSPRAIADLYGPFVDLAPMDAAGMPSRLEPGADVPVRMTIGAGAPGGAGGRGGGLSLGEQLIHVSERTVRDARGFPMRWEAIYAQAWAPEPGTPLRDAHGELAQVPLSRIPIRRRA